MQTININKAAEFLHMNAEVLRRKAKAGEIPGRKVGKCWVFVEEHLADFISGRYPDPRRGLQVIDGGKQEEANKPCQSTSEMKRGGYSSPRVTADAYANLLGQKTNVKRKNSTTGSSQKAGA